MPFYHWTLIASRPRPIGYPKQLITLGDHIRARRLDLRYDQKKVCGILGVSELMVCHWEKNRYEPGTRHLPKIIEFLGYAPYQTPGTFGEWLKLVCTSMGYSQRLLASLLGGDQRSIVEWEQGRRTITKRSVMKLTAILRIPLTAQGILDR